MEKRRRARINQSLNELKNLILEAMKKDVSQNMALYDSDIGIGFPITKKETKIVDHLLLKCLWPRAFDYKVQHDTFKPFQVTFVTKANGPGLGVVCYMVYLRHRVLFNVFKTIKNTKSLNPFFQTSCYSKLEKADILEMTVRYLRSVRNQNMTGKQNGESLIIEFRQCVSVLACFCFCTILNDSELIVNSLALNARTFSC